jgi:START domain
MWQKTPDYSIETRISERGFLVVRSRATINCSIVEVADVLRDDKLKPQWDPNYCEEELKMRLGDNVVVKYSKTKKIAVVSSRDFYLVVAHKYFDADRSPTKRPLLIIGAKSRDLFPVNTGVVRAVNYISGYYIEEVEKGKLEVNFLVESDFKISVFVMK